MRVNANPSLRIRTEGNTTSEIVGQAPYGSELDVISIVGDWAKVKLTSPNVTLNEFWALKQYVDLPVKNQYKLGVHCINNHQKAREVLSLGCPLVVVMNGKASAAQLARDFPKSTILYRIDSKDNSSQNFFNQLEVSKDDPVNLYYMGLNERPMLTVSSIINGSKFDVELADKINNKRQTSVPTFLAFSAGHGNPVGIEQKTMQDAMRTYYAPHYNSGKFCFDLHNYSCGTPPRVGTFVTEPQWFESRTNWLFTHCGFNPKIKRIFHSEAGIEGGCGDNNSKPGIPGGFNENKYSLEEFSGWVNRYLEIQNTPVLGENPNFGGAIFQIGDTGTATGHWGGYEISKYISELRKVW